MPRFFIIIPIYNVEAYLRECLESVSRQSFADFEAIMVNDGSTDNSGKIAREFAEADSRFTLISRENSGLSIARNTALKYIAKKYNGGGAESRSQQIS